MKKFFIVLLSLVVLAGGLFAEGVFSFSGESVVGGILLFPQGEPPVGSGGGEWNQYYREHGSMNKAQVYGEFTVGYDRDVADGNFHAELVLRGSLRDQSETALALNHPFEAVSNVRWLGSYETNQYKVAVGVTSDEFSFTSFKPNRDNFTYLYGWFYFWDRQIKVDLAYKGYDAVEPKYGYSEDLPLASDIVSRWDMEITSYRPFLPWWGNFEGINGARFTFTPDFLAGFILRFAWKDLFTYKSDPVSWWDWENEGDYEYSVAQYLQTFTVFGRYDLASQFNIPLAFSLGYANRDYKGLHVGASYAFTDAITAKSDVLLGGLVDMSKFGFMAIGGSGVYASAPFYADLNIRFGTDLSENPQKKGRGNFQVEPIIKYAVVPNTLLLRLGVAYTNGLGNYNVRGFYITPGLYWNLKADADTDEPDCGIRFLYTYGNFKTSGKTTKMSNDIEVSFHWNF
jgi:hypothetical protein